VERDFDLIIIGGGSGGLTAATAARKLGARVLLIDKNALGGECLFTGCVPSKTLIRTAKLAHELRAAERWGLAAAPPVVDGASRVVDGARVMARVREVIARVAEHDSPARFESLGVTVRIGAPRFVSPEELELDGTRLRARAFLVATGSRPAVPAIEGLTEVPYLTNETVWGIDAIPPSLAVLGGGPTGVELGQAMARLGAKVTIIEAADRLLPKEEPELAAALRLRLEAEGLAVHTAATIVRARRDGAGEIVLDGKWGGGAMSVRAARLLVATGRRPSHEGLGLEAAGVDVDARRIVVDDELRTTNPRVFAVGDVIGRLPFSHTAGLEAVVAVRNALLPLASRADYRAVPWVTFTDPELARVGLTETEARAREGREVAVVSARYDEIDRALTDGAEAGLAKIVTAGGRVVGAHILGAAAGEIIHVAALAVKEKLPLRALASMSWAYPTLSEVLRKAAQSRYEELLARPTAQRVVSILRRLK
jgi:pyruvate/2-oxoglutarate dehydrogenase complex dihydrolipoamide dehydrogenase (E3) component